MAGPTTDYASEMATPGHKPGMQGVSDTTSGAAKPPSTDPRDQNGNRIGPRRTAGPADSATQKKFLNEALSGSGGTAGSQSAPTAPSANVTKAAPSQPEFVGSGGLARERTIMGEVDQAAK